MRSMSENKVTGALNSGFDRRIRQIETIGPNIAFKLAKFNAYKQFLWSDPLNFFDM